MTIKSLFLVGALAVASLSIANAKTYSITLYNPAKVGNVQLKAGDYRVKVEGDQAVFTSLDSAKQYTAPVKVETEGKKFEETAVDSTNVSNEEHITSIEVGGTTTKLEFNVSE